MPIFTPRSPGFVSYEKDLSIRSRILRERIKTSTSNGTGGNTPTPTPINPVLWILLCGSWNDNYYWYDTSQWNDNTPC